MVTSNPYQLQISVVNSQSGINISKPFCFRNARLRRIAAKGLPRASLNRRGEGFVWFLAGICQVFGRFFGPT